MCGRGLGRGGHDTTGDLCSVGFQGFDFYVPADSSISAAGVLGS